MNLNLFICKWGASSYLPHSVVVGSLNSRRAQRVELALRTCRDSQGQAGGDQGPPLRILFLDTQSSEDDK